MLHCRKYCSYMAHKKFKKRITNIVTKCPTLCSAYCAKVVYTPKKRVCKKPKPPCRCRPSYCSFVKFKPTCKPKPIPEPSPCCCTRC